MADTTLPGVLLKGLAASRPAANAVAKGTIYSATDTGAITQSDGSSWSTYATISSGLADPMTTRGDIIIRNASNTTARLGRGSAGTVLTSDGTDVSWQAPSGGGSASELPLDAAATAAVGSGDLFNGTGLDGGWSDLQTTAVTTKDRSVAGYLTLKNTGNTAGAERGIKRAFSPAGDFTVWTKMLFSPLNTNFQWAGLFVGATDPSDAAGASRCTFFLLYNSGAKLKSEKWSGGTPTSVFDEYLDSLTGERAFDRGAVQWPIWMGIKRVGTTISYLWSFDGVSWVTHGTTTTIAFTVNTLGLYISETSATQDIRATYAYVATA